MNCELLLNSQTHSHLGIGKRKKTERTKGKEGYGKTEFGQDAAISVEEEAILCNHISHSRAVILTLSTPGYMLNWRPSCASLVAIEAFVS